MKIKHIEKVTLVDYPGKIACTVFLFGCNFRCGFCYNPSLVLKEETPDISEEELIDFLEKRKGKLEGVCFTGGEALIGLNKELLIKIREKGYLIKIDTNGSFPEKLKELIDAGLIDYVAMDVKATKEKYSETVGAKIKTEKLEESIRIISNLKNYEFRTTVIPGMHDSSTMLEILNWITFLTGKKIKNFYLQGFKNRGVFIDKSYSAKQDTSENFLKKLKQEISARNLVENLETRF